MVFTISGIWHGKFFVYYNCKCLNFIKNIGVHPMYFISFIHFAIYNDISKFFYKASDKFKWVPGFIRFGFKWYAGKTCVNYFGLGFYFLAISKTNEIYQSVYYTFTIIPILIHIFFSVT